jgi:hypothetical protein
VQIIADDKSMAQIDADVFKGHGTQASPLLAVILSDAFTEISPSGPLNYL